VSTLSRHQSPSGTGSSSEPNRDRATIIDGEHGDTIPIATQAGANGSDALRYSPRLFHPAARSEFNKLKKS